VKSTTVTAQVPVSYVFIESSQCNVLAMLLSHTVFLEGGGQLKMYTKLLCAFLKVLFYLFMP